MQRIRLPMLYGPHMMLQREKPLSVSGTASPGVKTIRLVLEGTILPPGKPEAGAAATSLPVISETAVWDHSFRLLLPPLPAAGSASLRFFVNGETEPELCLEDVAIGDLWMACGQSNMEYFLRYDADWNRTRKLEKNPAVRMFNVPRIAFAGQKKENPGSGFWFREGDEAWHLFSAPGWSFARTLAPALKVPVGIIGCNWGGTPACAWMAEKYCQEPPLHIFREEYEAEVRNYTPEELKARSEEALAFENSYSHASEWQSVMYGLTAAEQETWMREHAGDPQLPMGPWHHYRPFGLYHTMIEAVAPFKIKGFLWYQGESDSGHADMYDQTMQALVKCFRDTWQEQELPFLFVQLAPFGRWLDCTGENYARVREAQERAAARIPGAWMASIMDLGSYEDIHPKFKMEVGRRLALLALGHVYGRDILCDAPAAVQAEITDSSPDPGVTVPSTLRKKPWKRYVKLTFENAGDGLVSDGHPEEAFEAFRGGRPLRIAGAEIHGCSLLLEVEETDFPPENGISGESVSQTGSCSENAVCIRYACQDYCEVHLWNSAGLAARPFQIRIEA